MPRKTQQQTGRRQWWTRERVLQGMLRFYHDHGDAPVNTEDWHRRVRQPGKVGRRRPYPSYYAVLRWFPDFRTAWRSIDVEVDRGTPPWSDIENWYLRESIGILSRKEQALDLQRTPDAVHRQQYVLGLNAYERWGWTLNRLERVTEVQSYVFERYMAWGDLPYFRGSKTVYVDPGDLTVVRELDLDNLPDELERAMLHSLRERLVKVMAGVDWRRGRIWQVHQEAGLGRIRNKRRLDGRKPDPKPPGVEKGYWVRVARDVQKLPQLLGRIGLVHFTYWARQRSGNGIHADSGAAWYARVEFKSQHNRSKGPRVTYSVPLTFLVRVPAPGLVGNTKLRCRCGAVIVVAYDELPPETCAFCKQPLEIPA